MHTESKDPGGPPHRDPGEQRPRGIPSQRPRGAKTQGDPLTETQGDGPGPSRVSLFSVKMTKSDERHSRRVGGVGVPPHGEEVADIL